MKKCEKHYCLCEQKEFKCWIHFREAWCTTHVLSISLCVGMVWIQKFTQANPKTVSGAILFSIHIILSWSLGLSVSPFKMRLLSSREPGCDLSFSPSWFNGERLLEEEGGAGDAAAPSDPHMLPCSRTGRSLTQW